MTLHHGDPRYGAASSSTDSSITRQSRKNGKSAIPWWQWVIVPGSLAMVVSCVAFVTGAINFYDSNGKHMKDVFPILETPTFFILTSQATATVLTSVFEVVKIYHTQQSRWSVRKMFLSVLFSAFVLSAAAPIVYGVSDRSETWTEVITMILQFCATLSTILAGMISVFEAGHANDQRIYDEEIELRVEAHDNARVRNLQEQLAAMQSDLAEANTQSKRKLCRRFFARKKRTSTSLRRRRSGS